MWLLTGGSLAIVCGRVGSGKSSLLSGLLDELNCTPTAGGGEGCGYAIRGRAAFVAQEPWIQNMSVRENIVFGRPFERAKWERVVAACCLASDFAIMPDGDQTEIGERGVNLSGGQKQRVALARAVYSDADVYLLDDALSAVDPEVASKIFAQVIEGLLAEKTVVLVTHALQFCSRADQVVFMEEGKIAACGTFDEITAQTEGGGASFATLIGEHGASSGAESAKAADSADTEDVTLEEGVATKEDPAAAAGGAEKGKLVEEEEVASGSVGRELYMYYFGQ